MAKQTDDPWLVKGKLTDSLLRQLTPPATGNRTRPDGEVKGLGLRITANGARSFTLRYRDADGRGHAYTLGSVEDGWTVAQAREQARKLRHDKQDPIAERQKQRAEPTVTELAAQFDKEHIGKKRTTTQLFYRDALRLHVLPALGQMKVAAVSYRDLERLHHAIAKGGGKAKGRTRGGPVMANRCLSVASKMFALAVKWRMRADNPCVGVERSKEQPREKYLSLEQIATLFRVLNAQPNVASARAVKLLLLTGSRRGEVLGSRWQDIDLANGLWVKPFSAVKTARQHRLPLSGPTRELLSVMRDEAAPDAVYLFPGVDGGPQQNVQKFWSSVARQAGLQGFRLHDLRHSHASILVSQGFSLPLIGAMLGHTQQSTTQRYAHLFDDPLRVSARRSWAAIRISRVPRSCRCAASRNASYI